MILKWTNKYSGEVGYVKSIDYPRKHFVNTYNVIEAKQFVSVQSAQKAIEKLAEYGEADNNAFEILGENE